jgi:hypothetical protein
MSIYKNAITIGVVKHGFDVAIQQSEPAELLVDSTKDVNALHSVVDKQQNNFDIVFLDKDYEPVAIISYIDADAWLISCDEHNSDLFSDAFDEEQA